MPHKHYILQLIFYIEFFLFNLFILYFEFNAPSNRERLHDDIMYSNNRKYVPNILKYTKTSIINLIQLIQNNLN